MNFIVSLTVLVIFYIDFISSQSEWLHHSPLCRWYGKSSHDGNMFGARCSGGRSVL